MEALETIIKKLVLIQVTSAIITNVENDSCTVKTGTKKLFKVSLNAVLENAEDKLIAYPKVGSSVVIGIFENKSEAVILSFSDVEKVYFKKGTTELEADKDGVMVDREGENLKKVLNDLIDRINDLNGELQKVVVSIGVTPNVPALVLIAQQNDQIKQRLNKILK